MNKYSEHDDRFVDVPAPEEAPQRVKEGEDEAPAAPTTPAAATDETAERKEEQEEQGEGVVEDDEGTKEETSGKDEEEDGESDGSRDSATSGGGGDTSPSDRSEEAAEDARVPPVAQRENGEGKAEETPAADAGASADSSAPPEPVRRKVAKSVLLGEALNITQRDVKARASGYQYRRPDGTVVGQDQPLTAVALLEALAQEGLPASTEVRKVNTGVLGRFMPFSDLQVAIERGAEREREQQAQAEAAKEKIAVLEAERRAKREAREAARQQAFEAREAKRTARQLQEPQEPGQARDPRANPGRGRGRGRGDRAGFVQGGAFRPSAGDRSFGREDRSDRGRGGRGGRGFEGGDRRDARNAETFGSAAVAPSSSSSARVSQGFKEDASRVLTGEGILKQTAPLTWKYIDDSGRIQGPFSSSDMVSWFRQGYLLPTLRLVGIIGTNAPEPELHDFRPLKELVDVYLVGKRIYLSTPPPAHSHRGGRRH